MYIDSHPYHHLKFGDSAWQSQIQKKIETKITNGHISVRDVHKKKLTKKSWNRKIKIVYQNVAIKNCLYTLNDLREIGVHIYIIHIHWWPLSKWKKPAKNVSKKWNIWNEWTYFKLSLLTPIFLRKFLHLAVNIFFFYFVSIVWCP